MQSSNNETLRCVGIAAGGGTPSLPRDFATTSFDCNQAMMSLSRQPDADLSADPVAKRLWRDRNAQAASLKRGPFVPFLASAALVRPAFLRHFGHSTTATPPSGLVHCDRSTKMRLLSFLLGMAFRFLCGNRIDWRAMGDRWPLDFPPASH